MSWVLILVAAILTLFWVLRSPVQCLCQKSAPAASPPVSHPEAILDEDTEDSSSEDDGDRTPQDRPNVLTEDIQWEKTPEE